MGPAKARRRESAGRLHEMSEGERIVELLFPSLHHRKEGRLRHKNDFAQPPKQTQPGLVFLSAARAEKKPPRPRGQRMLRDILLIARPPLLAVTQGGEYWRPSYI